ncbi:putative D-lactate dehydrogenase (cytochrome) [Colletotrichum sublineola]|uniref:Putative D-lactate dehydrogenase (Cytochrome) n=1 Tax=Colletotrichum sublineola TaxID=1173701 RepID=A0A066XBY4_COLSU|nr:putative D-lactate dehydrogenase (cytochrome) [Colletotrichum sublineola]
MLNRPLRPALALATSRSRPSTPAARLAGLCHIHNTTSSRPPSGPPRDGQSSKQTGRPVLMASTLSALTATVVGIGAWGLATQSENGAVEEIRRALGEDAVSIEDEILRSHGYSEWSTINIERLPVAVAFPTSTEEVSIIAKICHRRRVPMIPYSGGSSVEGHFSAPFGGVSVDFCNMNRILEMHGDE